jgi:hypothetical protein
MQYTIVNILELPFMKAEVGDDAIVRIYFLKDLSISLQNMKDLFDFLALHLNTNTYYCLIFSSEDGGNASLTGGMDSSLVEHANKINRICAAVVTKNLTQRMIANFVIRYSNVKTPTKLVANMKEAEAYCHEMKEKQL